MYLGYALDKTVVCIRALVHARKTGESRIAGDLQGDAVLCSKLLQLPNDTVGDAWDDLRVEGLHCSVDDVELVTDRKADKVGVQQDVVGWAEGGVVAEKEVGGDLLDVSGLLLGLLGGLPLFLSRLSRLFAGIRGGDDPFDLCKPLYRLLLCLAI